jgi:hypothetical protein
MYVVLGSATAAKLVSEGGPACLGYGVAIRGLTAFVMVYAECEPHVSRM